MITEYNALTGEATERGLTPEEIAQTPSEIPYEQRVVNLIRQRYTIDDELAIQRQREEKPDEWQDYFDYCEWCKSES